MTSTKVTILIADEFRTEASGKLTAIGLYPQNRVIIDATPEQEANMQQVPLTIEKLTFLITVGPSLKKGAHKVKAEFSTPSLKRYAVQEYDDIEIPIGATHTIFMEAKPFEIMEEGSYFIHFFVDGTETDLEIPVILRSSILKM